MAKREALIYQADATRLLKAVKAAGYNRASLINHPDGRVEVVGEDIAVETPAGEVSHFENWKAKHAS